MKIQISFPCVASEEITHTAVIDITNYPEQWHVIKSDLDMPLIGDFDPCAKILKEGYCIEDWVYYSIHDLVYQWLCTSPEPLPRRGTVKLLERIFNDSIHESWNLRNDKIRATEHYHFAMRVIEKYSKSRRRFELLLEKDHLSFDRAFVRACLKTNPVLTCRIAYRYLMRWFPEPTDMPSLYTPENHYLEALMHPAGHGKLLKFFEQKDHETIVKKLLETNSEYIRSRATQYSKLAILILESEKYRRDHLEVQPFGPSHTKRALRIIRKIYNIMLDYYGLETAAQYELARMLRISEFSVRQLLPR